MLQAIVNRFNHRISLSIKWLHGTYQFLTTLSQPCYHVYNSDQLWWREYGHLDRNKLWFIYGFKSGDVHKPQMNAWQHWGTEIRNAFIKAMDDLHNIISNYDVSKYSGRFSKSEWQQFVTDFWKKYEKYIISLHYALFVSGDFFYFPNALKERYIIATSVFRANNCLSWTCNTSNLSRPCIY